MTFYSSLFNLSFSFLLFFLKHKNTKIYIPTFFASKIWSSLRASFYVSVHLYGCFSFLVFLLFLKIPMLCTSCIMLASKHKTKIISVLIVALNKIERYMCERKKYERTYERVKKSQISHRIATVYQLLLLKFYIFSLSLSTIFVHIFVLFVAILFSKKKIYVLLKIPIYTNIKPLTNNKSGI